MKSIKMEDQVHVRLRAIYDSLNINRKETGIYYTFADIISLLIDYYEKDLDDTVEDEVEDEEDNGDGDIAV